MAKQMGGSEDRKKPKLGQTLVWGMLVLIMLGLGGFGITNFGGGVTSIGRVGDRPIEAADYARALRQQVNQMSQQFGMQMTLEQARAFGIDQQVLRSLVSQAALDNEAERVGISVGNATLAAEIQKMDAFKGASGSFDRDAYRFALDRNNLTEAKFESGMRADTARQVLQGAIVGGFVAPKPLVESLAAWQGEKRSFSVLQLAEADLTAPLPAATEDQLKAVYDAKIDQFTKPEAKRITYAALTPEALAPSMPVDEAAVQKAYDERKSSFVVPEKRLVERLVYPDEAAAKDAKARLDAGKVSFDDLVAERKLALTDVDLGDVTKDELGAAGEAVFAMADPGVVGPLDSEFGPALYRMNAVLAAQETTLDQARADLTKELQLAAAKTAISDRMEKINDALASGAELEEAAKETGMTLATVDYAASEPGEGVLADAAFRKAADQVQEGDFPEAVLLDDGGVAALRLDQVVPAAPIPFDQAKEAVTKVWRADALAKALTARADEVKAAIEGGAAMGGFGVVSVTRDKTRDATLEGVPPDVIKTAFQMQPGEVRALSVPAFVGLVRLDAVTPAPTSGEEAESLRDTIAVQARRSMAQDAFGLFSDALGAEAGIELDQSAINAVNARLQ